MRPRLLLPFVCLLLALSSLPADAAPEPDAALRQLKRSVPAELTTSSDAARRKIHPDLASLIDRTPPARSLGFVARITAGTKLGEFADRLFVRPFTDPLGTTVAVGYAEAAGIEKIAALPGVVSVQRQRSIVDLPEPVDADVARQERRALRRQSGVGGPPAAPAPGPSPQGWYHTTGDVHGSQEAWAKGYTGDGVRYMSNDSGADYCHPDLAGTWQYIEDESSPYYGLPQMFDGFSVYNLAFDYYLGTDRVASGETDYADTSTVIEAPPRPPVGGAARFRASYRPLGADAEHIYTVPFASLSGEYHIGSHPDRALAFSAESLSQAFGDGSAAEGERAGVLVTDEREAGVYDTVYVDLDYDFDFSDERPAVLGRNFRGRESACTDYNGDGLNDISGGLVYFISDGRTPVPTADWYWGIPGDFTGNGDLVAFHVMDFAEPGGDHGQGTTSTAVGQGVVRGSIYTGPDGPPQANGQGLVVGPGRDVRSTQNGNFYIDPFIEDGFVFAALGYDATTGTIDDTQIISNSWGSSDIDHDGFDFESRLIDSIIRAFGPTMSSLHSTGNGAPGYGTSAPPSPPAGIGVGASTQYGSIGLFEPIASADQIVSGDVMSWSNRGPGALASAAVDVVATGAFGTGDLPLNTVFDGSIATADFGGTSMSAPVAAGNLALLYDAWRQRTGSWPSTETARELLKGSARNIDHDSFSQGAGLVDADEGTDAAAAGGAAYVSPAGWRVGDYRGTQYPGFAHVLAPGQSDTQEFTLHNSGPTPLTVNLDTNQFRLLRTRDHSFTTQNAELDHGEFTVPDYVFRIDRGIPKRTDLMQVRMTKPYEQFNPTGQLDGASEQPATSFNNWRVLLENWTDLDGDGRFWVDRDRNGKVSVQRNTDGVVTGSEMDAGEYIRFTYGYNIGPAQQARIANPLERIDDGLLLAFRHRDQVAEVPRTDLQVEASYWERAPWNWLDVSNETVAVPPGGTTTFSATLTVPARAPLGMYQGSILLDDGQGEASLPVSVAVAADGPRFHFGTAARRVPAVLYDNARLFGYTDYAWRAESGDWRFFWTDIDDADLPSQGTNYLVVDNDWGREETDVDTIVLGPTRDCFSNGGSCANGGEFAGDASRYGPYTLDTVGRSENGYLGSGRWRYLTSSDGSREMVAAPVQPGLHGVLLHQVRVDGSGLNDRFTGQAGTVNVTPGEVTATGARGSAEVTVNSDLDFEGVQAEGFGLSRPDVTRASVNQDDPNDPSTASFTKTVTLEHAAKLAVSTGESQNADLDLYLYGPDGELLGASTTPTDTERVELILPPDGEYTIAVHGWSVPTGTTAFTLTVEAIQGFDLQVAGLTDDLSEGDAATMTVSWDLSGRPPGRYEGIVFVGPQAAPALLNVPVRVTLPGG